MSETEERRQLQEQGWSIRRLLTWATQDFKNRDASSPRLDAELLLAHALGIDRIGLIVQAERELSSEELARYRDLIKRRRRGEPVAYILGRREFYGHDFRVDPRVLIPRPDTECLVEVALTRSAPQNMYGRMLDLCTGSGAVAIAFAKERPTWRVTATDIDENALALAHENARRLGAIWNMRFLSGDLLAPVNNERFELITANPPYIVRNEIPNLTIDIRDFEPHIALDGGSYGLEIIERIIRDAPAHLTPNGILAMEIGTDQAPRVRDAFLAAGFSDVQVRRDYGGNDRVVSATLLP